MYVNVFFVMSCLCNTVSLTLVREQRFIRIIYYDYYYESYPDYKTTTVCRRFYCKSCSVYTANFLIIIQHNTSIANCLLL